MNVSDYIHLLVNCSVPFVYNPKQKLATLVQIASIFAVTIVIGASIDGNAMISCNTKCFTKSRHILRNNRRFQLFIWQVQVGTYLYWSDYYCFQHLYQFFNVISIFIDVTIQARPESLLTIKCFFTREFPQKKTYLKLNQN